LRLHKIVSLKQYILIIFRNFLNLNIGIGLDLPTHSLYCQHFCYQVLRQPSRSTSLWYQEGNVHGSWLWILPAYYVWKLCSGFLVSSDFIVYILSNIIEGNRHLSFINFEHCISYLVFLLIWWMLSHSKDAKISFDHNLTLHYPSDRQTDSKQK